MVIQFTGLSGAGKTTLAALVKKELLNIGFSVLVIDGDEIRKGLSKDLGFTKADRLSNIKRMAEFAKQHKEVDLIIISAINPFNESRDYLKGSLNAKLVWIDCEISELKTRDTKGLYYKALLPNNHPEKIFNLTGINATFEIPELAECYINTYIDNVEICLIKLKNYILENLR